jgi:hypothetical protein
MNAIYGTERFTLRPYKAEDHWTVLLPRALPWAGIHRRLQRRAADASLPKISQTTPKLSQTTPTLFNSRTRGRGRIEEAVQRSSREPRPRGAGRNPGEPKPLAKPRGPAEGDKWDLATHFFCSGWPLIADG